MRLSASLLSSHQRHQPAIQATCALLLVLLLSCGHCTEARKACSAGCLTHGTCNEELGRCDCPWNFTGPSCEVPYPEGFCLKRLEVNTCVDDHPTLCVNACNGRGACKGGFCHCDPGYFGTDCSLSYGASPTIQVLDGLGYKPNKRGPSIYIYELPPEFHVKRDIHKIDRPPLHLAMYERIVAGGHRTADGENADFYFVPITSRDLKKAFLLMPALDYISHNWPYWNRTGGKRHIIPMEGDVGTCELPLAVRRITDKVTWLQFWGMYDFHPSWKHIFHNRIPCFVPGRDIVVPFMAMSSHDRFLIETPLRPGAPQRPRNLTFFFSGGVCGSGRYNAVPPNCNHYKMQRYSGGVRQAFYENYHTRPGWKVVTRTDDYARDYASSKFCLAAPGGGWGKRGIVSAMYGCIPVTATDFLYEAFEPELDWGHFGVKVAQKDIPKLGELLEGFTEEQIREKQERVRCAAQHFHWSGNIGGIMQETGEFDAFNTMMAILRMRKTYPDKEPQSYYQLDQEYRDFVDCKPFPGSTQPRLPMCTMWIGPGMSDNPLWPDACPAAKYYLRRKIGPPGGSLCINATDLTSYSSNVQHPALCSMFVGPLLIRFDDTCPNAKYYLRRKMGPPGGAICVGQDRLTQCTRFD